MAAIGIHKSDSDMSFDGRENIVLRFLAVCFKTTSPNEMPRRMLLM